jgi:hypothetical protein
MRFIQLTNKGDDTPVLVDLDHIEVIEKIFQGSLIHLSSGNALTVVERLPRLLELLGFSLSERGA